jgi:hypothetical protein
VLGTAAERCAQELAPAFDSAIVGDAVGAYVSPTLVGAAVPVKHSSCLSAAAAPVACMFK